MSFQKLFKTADVVSGLATPFPLEQADTSAFDEQDEEQPAATSRVTIAEREVEKWRSVIKRVKVAPVRESMVFGRTVVVKEETAVQPARAEELHTAHPLPDISWEAEVDRLMEVDSSEDEIQGQKLQGGLAAKGEGKSDFANAGNCVSIVRRASAAAPTWQPFVCFDAEDTEDGAPDPLDVLIPNPDRDAFMSVIPVDSESEDDQEVGVSESAPALPSAPARAAPIVTASEADNSVTERVDMSLMSKAERDKQRKLEKAMRIKGVDIGFDAASSIERSANMRPRDSLPQYRSRANRSLIAALNHCNIATSHKNAKPDLYEVELKYFHRPRMIRERDRPWQIIPKTIHRKNMPNAKHSPGSGLSGGSKLASADVDKQNLSITGSQADFILLEYVEEFPPVVLNYGMASAMFNYYRAPEQNEDEGDAQAQAREGSSKVVASVLSDRHRSRLPRHLLLLLQLRNVKQAYDHDVSVPRLKQGETKVLNTEDDSPFLGKIEEGEIQQSFTNNLFRAPIFKHTHHPTDFLLIRTKLTTASLTYTMREIPALYLCGQLEPQKIVPRPVPMITQLQEKFYLLGAVRYLQAHFDGADFEDLQRNLLKYCLKERSSPHKAQHRQKLKAIVRKVGDEVRDMISAPKWYCRDFSERAADAEEAAELERRFSPEEIARSFTPEDVCLQESCNAAEYRLFQQHITDVDLSKVEMWLTHTHRVKQLQMDRAEKAKRLANECKSANPALSQSIEQFISVLIKQIRRTDAKLAVGRFIFDRLVSAPWNTTEAYVRSHLDRDGQGKLELQGVGDPSGCGEGFAFVRIVKSQRASGPAAKKNTVKYYDTDKDLRKLTKKDAVRLLVALGVREVEAMALKRWDRVHMIREFSTKLEKTGLAKELHKYARSGVESTATSTGESFHVIAQEIWNRQKKALTNTSTIVSAPPASATASHRAGSSSSGAETGADKGSDAEDSDNDSDEDFAENIARSLAVRAAASASIEEKNIRSKEQVEEEKKELSNMSTFFSALDKPAPSTSSSSAFGASLSKFGEGALVQKKRKVHVGISGLGQSEAEGQNEEGADQMAFTISVPVAQPSTLPADWPRPRRVVKRTIRTVLSDGTESIRIEFVLADTEADRVDRSSARWKKERELRRSATGAHGYAGGQGAEEEEENDDVVPASIASMKINLSRMKKVADQGSLVLKRERGEVDVDDPYYNSYGTAGSKIQKSSKRSAEIVINNRVPRVSLAARLEEELMKLWNSKHAAAFRRPVTAAEAPGYFARVAEPISLSDIREKIVLYHYETAAAMLEDVEKMARNSETYNGPAHPITASAKKLVSMLGINLRHDREHLGAEHDQISFMEEAIRRKKVYLRKGQVDAAMSNPLLPGDASSR